MLLKRKSFHFRPYFSKKFASRRALFILVFSLSYKKPSTFPQRSKPEHISKVRPWSLICNKFYLAFQDISLLKYSKKSNLIFPPKKQLFSKYGLSWRYRAWNSLYSCIFIFVTDWVYMKYNIAISKKIFWKKWRQKVRTNFC